MGNLGTCAHWESNGELLGCGSNQMSYRPILAFLIFNNSWKVNWSPKGWHGSCPTKKSETMVVYPFPAIMPTIYLLLHKWREFILNDDYSFAGVNGESGDKSMVVLSLNFMPHSSILCLILANVTETRLSFIGYWRKGEFTARRPTLWTDPARLFSLSTAWRPSTVQKRWDPEGAAAQPGHETPSGVSLVARIAFHRWLLGASWLWTSMPSALSWKLLSLLSVDKEWNCWEAPLVLVIKPSLSN